LVLDDILTNNLVNDNSTKHLLLESLLTSARKEEHLKLLVRWFDEGVIYNTKGTLLEGVEVSKKHKHSILQRICSSEIIPLSEKNKRLE
jgi:hypothetical protein